MYVWACWPRETENISPTFNTVNEKTFNTFHNDLNMLREHDIGEIIVAWYIYAKMNNYWW